MNKDTFPLLRSNFYEIKDVLCSLIVLIEKNLAFDILPKEGEIDDAKSLPLVLDLFARAVNYP